MLRFLEARRAGNAVYDLEKNESGARRRFAVDGGAIQQAANDELALSWSQMVAIFVARFIVSVVSLQMRDPSLFLIIESHTGKIQFRRDEAEPIDKMIRGFKASGTWKRSLAYAHPAHGI